MQIGEKKEFEFNVLLVLSTRKLIVKLVTKRVIGIMMKLLLLWDFYRRET